MGESKKASTDALRRALHAKTGGDASKPRASQPGPQKLTRILGVCAALILVAIALGGGGVRYGMANLIVQLTALGILAFYRDAFFRFWKEAPITLTALTTLTLALPVVHLIPLPMDLWAALPGRGLAAEARAAVGADGWAPLSLDQARTWVALSGLIVPLTVLAVGWSVPRSQLFLLGWVVVAMGVVNVLIGATQVLSSAAIASFYPETPMPGVLFGTFANRNSTGVFLVVALTLALTLPPPKLHPAVTPARIAIAVLLILGVFLTRSRTALALSMLPLLLLGLKTVFSRAKGRAGSREWMIAAGGLATIAVIAGLLTLAPGRIGDTLERFDRDDDPRSYIWEDATYSAGRYWPAGSGMGTFDEVFQIDESLENMTQRRAGRAHNDYIEVAIEAGLPGLILIAGWLIAWGLFTIRAGRAPDRWIAWSGSVILLCIALQSITDYPLRNQSMLAVGALALLLLARAEPKKADGSNSGDDT